MQPAERKRRHRWKQRRIVAVAAALLLLGGSIAVYSCWFRTTGERTSVSEPAAGEKAGTAQARFPEAAAEGLKTDRTGSGQTETADRETQQAGTAYMIPEQKNTGGTLQNRQPDELESVTVSRRGKESWTLIRDDAGDMHLQGSGDWTVKERLAGQILDAVTNLVYEDIVTDDPSEYRERLKDFGLDDPYIIVEARFTDGKEMTVRLGNEIPIAKSVRYMTVDGDERLYAVSHSLAEDLGIEKESLHPVTQPEIYPVLLDRIAIYGKDGNKKAELQLRGAITDQDAGTNWEITTPFRYPADETVIENLKTNAGNLRMGIFLNDASEEYLEEYGLAEPDYTLELHMAAGSTGTVSGLGVYDVVEREGGTVILYVSRSENELIDYVRFGDEIFRASHLTLSAFLDIQPENTAARYIVPTPFNSLDSMTVEKDGTIDTYTLERTGQTDPETAEETVICRKNGEEISLEAFEAAYERLMTVTVGGDLPAGAEWKDAHTKYAFRSVSGGTHTVELSGWDGMHDAVTMDGETRFYLIERGAEFTLITR